MMKLWQDVCLTLLVCALLPTLLNAQGEPPYEEIPVPAKCQLDALLLHVGTDDGSTKTTFQCRCNNIEYNPSSAFYFEWHYRIPSRGVYPYTDAVEMRLDYKPALIYEGEKVESDFFVRMFHKEREFAAAWRAEDDWFETRSHSGYQITNMVVNTEHTEHDILVNEIGRHLDTMPEVLLDHLVATNFSVFPKQLSFQFIFTFVEPPSSTPSNV
jgi:hypothetical protein